MEAIIFLVSLLIFVFAVSGYGLATFPFFTFGCVIIGGLMAISIEKNLVDKSEYNSILIILSYFIYYKTISTYIFGY